MKALVCCCRTSTPATAIFDHHLETAGHADAGHRRGTEHVTIASGTFSAHSRRSLTMIASALRPWPRRWSNGSRITNIEPKFELFALSKNDKPDTQTVCSTPGTVCAQPLDSIHHFLRAPQLAESGNCTLTSS